MQQFSIRRRVLAGFLALFISMSLANRLRTKMNREAPELERKNDSLQSKDFLSKISVKMNNTFRTLNNSNNWMFILNTTGRHDDAKFNSSNKEVSSGCHGDESPAICHTYIHNMYQFYSTIGGFVMLAIVFTGISFLIITHFHGRHIVKTNQHVVGTIAKWDAIQHRKQQARERNGNWI